MTVIRKGKLPQILIGASSSNKLGCCKKISLETTQSWRISDSDSWTCFPGRVRTSRRRLIISSKTDCSILFFFFFQQSQRVSIGCDCEDAKAKTTKKNNSSSWKSEQRITCLNWRTPSSNFPGRGVLFRDRHFFFYYSIRRNAVSKFRWTEKILMPLG